MLFRRRITPFERIEASLREEIARLEAEGQLRQRALIDAYRTISEVIDARDSLGREIDILRQALMRIRGERDEAQAECARLSQEEIKRTMQLNRALEERDEARQVAATEGVEE